MPIPVILDVDTGIDDALAILFAVKHPDIDLRGITCVAGNAALDQVVANTLAVLDMAQAGPVPVAAGAMKPLIEPARNASHVHGDDGLAGTALPPSARTVERTHAVEWLRQTLTASADPITIVCLAPQTNLAVLLTMYPHLADKIGRVIFMGGSIGTGNATPVAEFNIWHDPEAAHIVLQSGIPTLMYGLDVFMQVTIPETRALAMVASGRPLEGFIGTLLSYSIRDAEGRPTAYEGLIGDAGAVCALVDPKALDLETVPALVDLSSGPSRGQTQVDRRTTEGEDFHHQQARSMSTIQVAIDVDAERYAKLFMDTVLFKEQAQP
ncbi:nucleoside hydrolase (plasmid) [Arthrobacter sp. ERGS1:01]|uniref:nucleoside hydrolase n=1 Tax=Arthrobacter sp. ERGS1:01 TaxID=1704044 RepID=UPI0006B5CFE2|nr:nucleoside hydrolase [Arthrobacter sp. ERGS1:01]ALE04619.1 nucleoside hydrolase [Arthrobacter sp. ERGS1:01]